MKVREDFDDEEGREDPEPGPEPGPMRVRDLYLLLLAARMAFLFSDTAQASTLVRVEKAWPAVRRSLPILGRDGRR